MITARPAATRPRHPASAGREPGLDRQPGSHGESRVSRRLERKRRTREQLLVGLVLLVLLAVTVTLLAFSWLDSGSTTSSSARAAIAFGGAP